MAAFTDIDKRGWMTIAVAMLGVSVSVIPVSILSLGVFMKPLGQAYGWGRGDIALTLTILSVGMALAMPFAGRLIDRHGVRVPILASLLLFGGGTLCLPTLIDAFGLKALYCGAFWVGVTGSPSSSIAYVKVLSGWFDRSRGLALGFAMSGLALGGAVAPVLAARLIAAFDWRAGFHGLATLPLLIGIPNALLIREAPAAGLVPGDVAAAPAAGVTIAGALRHRVFWMLLTVFFASACAIHGVQIHLAPLLSDRALTPSDAALGVGFMFGISAVARLVSGHAFDRMFAPRIGALCFMAACVGAALLIPPSEPLVYLAAVALLGIGAGAEGDLMAILVSRYFGLRAFGAIYGILFGAFMIGSALGPLFLGLGFDATGSYASSLIWCAAGLLFAVTILLALPRFPKAASTDGEPLLAADLALDVR